MVLKEKKKKIQQFTYNKQLAIFIGKNLYIILHHLMFQYIDYMITHTFTYIYIRYISFLLLQVIYGSG